MIFYLPVLSKINVIFFPFRGTCPKAEPNNECEVQLARSHSENIWTKAAGFNGLERPDFNVRTRSMALAVCAYVDKGVLGQ